MAFGFGGFPNLQEQAMRSLGAGPSQAPQAMAMAQRFMGGGGGGPPMMGQPPQGPQTPAAPPPTAAGGEAAAGGDAAATGGDFAELLAALFGA